MKEPVFYARRCDIEGIGINTGYVWRRLGIITGEGEASRKQASRLGYESLEDAQMRGAAVFKLWSDPSDVRYMEDDDGSLLTLAGDHVGIAMNKHDEIQEVANIICTVMSDTDRRAFARCLTLGAAVMRERVHLAEPDEFELRNTEAERAEAYAFRVASTLLRADDW